jgi:hypothetical protein
MPARVAGPPAARLSALRHAGEVQGLALRQAEDGERRPRAAAPGGGARHRVLLQEGRAGARSRVRAASAPRCAGEPLLIRPLAHLAPRAAAARNRGLVRPGDAVKIEARARSRWAAGGC